MAAVCIFPALTAVHELEPIWTGLDLFVIDPDVPSPNCPELL